MSIKKTIIILFFCIVIFGIYYIYSWKQREYVELWALMVGQGDSILIRTPNNKFALIDGGPGFFTATSLGYALPPGAKNLDLVVATHADADHIGGFPQLFSYYTVNTFLEGPTGANTPHFKALKQYRAKVTHHLKAYSGGKITLDGVLFEVVWPDKHAVSTEKDRNDLSIVLKVSYKGHCAYLMGDAGVLIEQKIALRLTSCGILKAGHHGSKTSTGKALLEKVRPTYTLLSYGKNNQFGHPHASVIHRLKTFNSTILTTESTHILCLLGDTMTCTEH